MAHMGKLRVIGQNDTDIFLHRYYKEPTLYNGMICINSKDVAVKVANILADAVNRIRFKRVHLFMLGTTALPVPTRNMWVRRTKRRMV